MRGAVLEPLLPAVRTRGRPGTDHRPAVDGMVWRCRTGAPWRDVPERFGKWSSIYQRFARRAAGGTWDPLLAQVHTLADAEGTVEWMVSIDSTIARVHRHGASLARRTGGCAERQESAAGAA